ncbi:MAG: SagB/ThcOx family dehydrogenase [Candidatus Latescibacterota bacterium]
MNRLLISILIFVVSSSSTSGLLFAQGNNAIPLPQPRFKSPVSVEEALKNRRTIRTFRDAPLTLAEISQLLWAAQGITATRGTREFRTAPSAGALYGLETYLAAAKAEGLEPGLYRYVPKGHELVLIRKGDLRKDLNAATLGQASVEEGAASIIFAAVYERITQKYKERGQKFAILEAGHASQNVYLQAEALGLGTVAVGSFSEADAKKVLGLPAEHEPLYIMPVGRKE